MTLFDLVKNIFIILIFLQIAPILVKNIKKQYTLYFEPRTSVGVLTVKGVLYDSGSYTKQLYKFFKNQEIKALLINMNCLGSAAGTGQIIYNEILALKKEYPKPVIVLVENICVSGGYLIACSADYIVAPASAIIGNIGSYFSSFQLKEFIEKFKKNYSTVKAETYKTITDSFVDLTEEEKALIQGLQNDSYEEFTQTVAKARKLSLAHLNKWADGKIFTGKQAIKLNLIDEIGSKQNAIKVIKEKALIEGEIKWIKIPTKYGLFDLLSDSESSNDNVISNILSNIFTFLESEVI